MTNKTLQESVSSPSEVERTSPQGWYEQPVIPFIPEAKATSGARDDFIKLVLKVNVDANGTTNTIKKSVQIFASGSIEELII